MGDQSPQDTMNLDLNLGPVVHPSQDNQPQTTRSEEEILRALRSLAMPQLPSLPPSPPVLPVSRHIPVQIEQPHETIKVNENGEKQVEKKVLGKEEVEKSDGDECSFFDCNICLDLASDPVVTCCGHLFCWPCLYRWLFVHSDAKECPICKGEVTMKTITPIYSRGNQKQVTKDSDSGVNIPSRPQANRIESWRQSIQRTAFNMPMLEMIQWLENNNPSVPVRETGTENPQETPLLGRIFTSRGIRRGRDAPPTTPPDATGDPQTSSSMRRSSRLLNVESLFQVMESRSQRRRLQ